MKQLMLDLFSEFECIGSACPNTCCAGWAIQVDTNTLNSYKNVSGPFSPRLKNNLISHNDKTFIQLENNRCAFLNKENLCDIYIELGPDKMCDICRLYPRISWHYGDILFNGLTLSCPEVARLLLGRKEPIQFLFNETTDSETGSKQENWGLFNTLIRGLSTSTDLMQNRELSFSNRLALLALFNNALSDSLDANQDCTNVFESLASPTLLANILPSFKGSSNYTAVFSYLQTMYTQQTKFEKRSLLSNYLDKIPAFLVKYVAPENAEAFEQLLSCLKTDTYDLHFEQYCIYYLSRYYMHTYTGFSLHKCISNLVFLYKLHFCFLAILLDEYEAALTTSQKSEVFVAISRCFEHTKENMDALFEIFEDANLTSTISLLSLIL